ncbi:hypothetical protein [Flaviaesturariibacter amylovorans]|uniref:Uncharacterized protein n=1 Tax=Flaviaesturariibacter amylovorans TaxID=1084520 RepID=A0ABP8GN09_9BACT
MRTALKLAFLSLTAFLLAYGTAFCQDGTPPEPDDEFNLFLLLFGLCAIVGALVLFVLLTLLVAALILGLSAAGALSASLITGWQQRSVAAGFRSFLRTGLTVFGGLTGALLMWLVSMYFFEDTQVLLLCTVGFVAGALSGLLFAGLSIAILRWSLRFAQKKLGERVIKDKEHR